jgi:hypothetical protein
LTENRAEQIARFARTPWYLQTVRLGSMLARPGADRRSLDLHRFGESARS